MGFFFKRSSKLYFLLHRRLGHSFQWLTLRKASSAVAVEEWSKDIQLMKCRVWPHTARGILQVWLTVWNHTQTLGRRGQQGMTQDSVGMAQTPLQMLCHWPWGWGATPAKGPRMQLWALRAEGADILPWASRQNMTLSGNPFWFSECKR